MRSLDSRATVQDTLDAIVSAARDTVPGFNHVGIAPPSR
jgi:hypothetical protein